MMNKTNGSVGIREMLKGMSLSQKEEFFSTYDGEKDQVAKVKERRTTFLNIVKEWGYPSPTDFLIDGEFIPNPNLKRPRTVIDEVIRKNIIEDLKLGVKTKEISSKYGVTPDAIYNIKGKASLTTPRKKKDEPTPSSPPSIPSVVPPTESVTIPTNEVLPSSIPIAA